MNTRIHDGPGPPEEARPPSSRPSLLNREVRKWFRQTKSEALRWLEKNDAILSFRDLYVKESRQLGDEVDTKSVSVVTGTAGEPWVAFTPKDRFGLALSGGGIRSATFNLGLLQALAQLGVLRRSEEHTSELQSRLHLVCRLLLEKKKKGLEHTVPVSWL